MVLGSVLINKYMFLSLCIGRGLAVQILCNFSYTL